MAPKVPENAFVRACIYIFPDKNTAFEELPDHLPQNMWRSRDKMVPKVPETLSLSLSHTHTHTHTGKCK